MTAWEDYTEALRVLARAAEAGRGKLAAVEEASKRAVSAAENRLATAVQERQQLERRLGQLDGLCRKVLTEGGVPATGPADSFDLGSPETTRAALATLDRLEDGLRESLAELELARSVVPVDVPPPPPPAATGPPRTPVWVWAVIAASALVLVLVLVLGAI